MSPTTRAAAVSWKDLDTMPRTPFTKLTGLLATYVAVMQGEGQVKTFEPFDLRLLELRTRTLIVAHGCTSMGCAVVAYLAWIHGAKDRGHTPAIPTELLVPALKHVRLRYPEAWKDCATYLNLKP